MISRAAWHDPARHGIPHGTVSHTAQYPTAAWYPARHGITPGTVGCTAWYLDVTARLACTRLRCASRSRSRGLVRRQWPTCHICAGTGLAPATSAPGLSSFCHICAGTGSPLPLQRRDLLASATSAPGLGESRLACLRLVRKVRLCCALAIDWVRCAPNQPCVTRAGK